MERNRNAHKRLVHSRPSHGPRLLVSQLYPLHRAYASWRPSTILATLIALPLPIDGDRGDEHEGNGMTRHSLRQSLGSIDIVHFANDKGLIADHLLIHDGHICLRRISKLISPSKLDKESIHRSRRRRRREIELAFRYWARSSDLAVFENTRLTKQFPRPG